jgi:hypothetical protein
MIGARGHSEHLVCPQRTHLGAGGGSEAAAIPSGELGWGMAGKTLVHWWQEYLRGAVEVAE